MDATTPPPAATRRHVEWLGLALVVVIAVAGVSLAIRHRGESAKPPATTMHLASVRGVTTQLMVPRHTVAPGATLHATVVVDNTTGSPLHGERCGSPFAVELHQPRVGQQTMWTTCAQAFTVPVGRSDYQVTIVARAGQCQPRHVQDRSGDLPECDPDGKPPALASGHYQAEVVGQEQLVSSAPPVDIDVR